MCLLSGPCFRVLWRLPRQSSLLLLLGSTTGSSIRMRREHQLDEDQLSQVLRHLRMHIWYVSHTASFMVPSDTSLGFSGNCPTKVNVDGCRWLGGGGKGGTLLCCCHPSVQTQLLPLQARLPSLSAAEAALLASQATVSITVTVMVTHSVMAAETVLAMATVAENQLLHQVRPLQPNS